LRPGPIVNLPAWVWLIYFDIRYWFLTAPVGIGLVLLAWYGADWPRGPRWIAFGFAAVLLLPFPVAGLFVTIGEIRSAAELARLQLTLDHDQTIAGLSVPAGSVIRFQDKAHSGVGAIELPRPSDVGSARLEGTLSWSDVTQVWNGTLNEDRLLDGLPCRAGPVELERDGSIRQCEISAPYARFGMTLPAGSNVTRGDAGRPWSLRLPPDAGVFIPVLATDAPAGITLEVANDGRLQRITSGGGQTIVVRGVPLNSMNFFLRGDQVVAALAQPFAIEGKMQTAETGVRIDLASGAVTVAGGNWWLSE
jgi:hypothetical protein